MRLLAYILLLSLPTTGFSQESLRDSLAEINRKIVILTEEIEKLKLGEVVAEKDQTTERGLGPAASKVYALTKSGVSVAGYGEVLYENYKSKLDNGNASATQDQFDYLRNIVYFGYRFNDWILFNSEIEFEHGYTGKFRGDKPIGEVGVEFGYVELMFSRKANLRAGMLLVPVGIVNEKHEPSTFFGTKRPQVEQVIVPSTWRGNGIGFYGEIFPNVNYRAYLMEGLDVTSFSSSGIRGGRQLGSKAFAEKMALTGKVEYSGLPGAVVGVSFFTGNSNQSVVDSLKNFKPTTTVLSAHGEYEWKGLEARAMIATISVADAARASQLTSQLAGKTIVIGSEMFGFYGVIGYDVMPLLMPGSAHYLAPFVQYEKFNTHSDVPTGYTKNRSVDRSIKTAGLSYKPHPHVAFKFDYRWNANKAGTDNDQWNLALNYLF